MAVTAAGTVCEKELQLLKNVEWMLFCVALGELCQEKRSVYLVRLPQLGVR